MDAVPEGEAYTGEVGYTGELDGTGAHSFHYSYFLIIHIVARTILYVSTSNDENIFFRMFMFYFLQKQTNSSMVHMKMGSTRNMPWTKTVII